MSDDNIYVRLAAHLQYLGMGYPPGDALLAIPTDVIPLQPTTVDESAQAACRIVARPDRVDQLPESDFVTLHEKILSERRAVR